MPKISVCIPTFNRAQHLLPSAIESVLQQTYQDWELIICDDGSSDGTYELMKKYQDTRIKYIRHLENIGKSNNMRSGFYATTGEYFIKFDDDDKLTPNFLASTSKILEQDSRIDFVSTDHWIIDINNIRDERKTHKNSLFWGRTNLREGIVDNLLEVVFVRQSFQIGATLFRRQVLQKVDFMRPNLQNCEDNDLLVRLALANAKGYFLPELLMEYRVHEGQKCINAAIPYLSDKIKYLESYKFEIDKLESIRKKRLAEAQLVLGLRWIQKSETQKGRELVLLGKSFSLSKALVGLGLSFLPLGMRSKSFSFLRKLKGETS